MHLYLEGQAHDDFLIWPVSVTRQGNAVQVREEHKGKHRRTVVLKAIAGLKSRKAVFGFAVPAPTTA